MKKKLLSLVLLCLVSSISFAKHSSKNVRTKSFLKQNKEAKKFVGRQCCTVSSDVGGLGIVSATACSGWFLSNDAQSFVNACHKASDALATLLKNAQQ